MFASDNGPGFEAVLAALPRRIACGVERAAEQYALEEIRLRTARPVQLITAEGEHMLDAAPFGADEAAELLEKLCRHSVYAHAEELRSGFITVRGGVRVGLCGRPSVENGSITGITEICGFNIRMARQVIGCAVPVMRFLIEDGRPVSALIASPPGGGKTTLLRDIARNFSEGVSAPAVKVAIADERGELAGCSNGAPGFDVGRRTDVMDRAPKAESIKLLIRSMSPNVILTDEIGGADDAAAVAEAARCGAAVIASAHASDMQELIMRGCTSRLIKERVFKRVLLIKRQGSTLRVSPAEV